MKKLAVSRRSVLSNVAAVATIAALGIKPEHVLGAESGALRVRQVNDIQVLDPGYIIGNAEVSILYACMPRLAVPTRDAEGTWTWQPSDYVEALSQTDPLHISFALKPGLMWSDGAGELTADDVKFSFERMLKADWSSRWPTLDHVDVTDKHRGVIVLKSPFVATWLLGLASESGSLVPKTLVEKLKDGKFTTQLPAQLGPYRMTEWTPKQKVVLKADDSWRGTRPAFEEVHFIDIEDTNAADLAVEAGEVDLASISPGAAARYKKTPPARAKLVALPGHQFTWLGMNTQNPKLQEIRVRKAIQRAIDVESILAGAYSGVSPLAHGVIHIGVLGHRTTTNYDYDPEQAKALLKEAGVSGLSLDIKTLSGQGEQLAAAQIIQANLGEIGISATVSPVDSGVFWNLGLESKGDAWKTLELWIMRFGSAPDPADAIQWFTKNQIGIWNWERWSDPAFEALWQAGLAETDAAKRSEIYIKMQDIMEGTGAYVWLTFDPKFYGCKTSISPAFEPGNDVRVELCRM